MDTSTRSTMAQPEPDSRGSLGSSTRSGRMKPAAAALLVAAAVVALTAAAGPFQTPAAQDAPAQQGAPGTFQITTGGNSLYLLDTRDGEILRYSLPDLKGYDVPGPGEPVPPDGQNGAGGSYGRSRR